MRRLTGQRPRSWHVFRRAEDAVAAVEFALILPLMVLLYVGASELSQAVMTSRRVDLLSRTLVDLTSLQPTFAQATSSPAPSNALSGAAASSILDAAAALMAPGSLTPLTMTLSAVDIVNNGLGICCSIKVRWSYTQSGVLRPCATELTPVDPHQKPMPTTISSALVPQVVTLSAPVSVLVSDVSYVYTGPFSSRWLDFSSGMSNTNYMYPRTPGQVILQGPVPVTQTRNGVVCY